MANDVDLQKQAEEFLNGLAPRPVPPSSRRKKKENITTSTDNGVADEPFVKSQKSHSTLIQKVERSEPDESDDYIPFSDSEKEFIRKYFAVNPSYSGDKNRCSVFVSKKLRQELMRIVQPTLGEVSFYALLNNIVETFLNEHNELLQSIRIKYRDKNF